MRQQQLFLRLLIISHRNIRPTVKEMIKCETATIVFKSFNNLASVYLSHLLIRNSDGNTINLRNAEIHDKLLIGRRRLYFVERKLISREAEQATSSSSFKKRIKS